MIDHIEVMRATGEGIVAVRDAKENDLVVIRVTSLQHEGIRVTVEREDDTIPVSVRMP